MNTSPVDIKWHLAGEHSHLSTAMLAVRDGNSHWPLHSTKLQHPKHISSPTGGALLGTSDFRTSGCSL